MQSFTRTTLAAAICLAAGMPALADENPILVHSQEAMQEWQADVTRSLDRRLVNVERARRVTPVSGIVQLRFTLDADGRPQDLKTFTSSGDGTTDRLAIAAVGGLTQLARAPVANVASQTFQANIIFAKNILEHAKLAKKLDQMEAARLARRDSTRVINIGA